MSKLTVRRVRFCAEADSRLKTIKARSGITPNLLCRIGFCMSLEEPGVPNLEHYPEDSAREINRYTLTGEYDEAFETLLRQRIINDGLSPSELDMQFKAHMNRGVLLLNSRARSLVDISPATKT